MTDAEGPKETDYETKPGQEDNKRRRTDSHGGFPDNPPDLAPEHPGTSEIDAAKARLKRDER
ncbi:hypothetical protein [Lichenicoccus roseus]|uniref:Uncharacterized protein n=1 Tax=Lichenicoccus roseus TaxID=2683649 RepID=A0A5R9J6N2_9PROT|nr:hypothetical protein [Lichenicoccus roseus]TLU73265.1 hypothetical protein FE263_07590 [Lichenicoccus roseus]